MRCDWSVSLVRSEGGLISPLLAPHAKPLQFNLQCALHGSISVLTWMGDNLMEGDKIARTFQTEY